MPGMLQPWQLIYHCILMMRNRSCQSHTERGEWHTGAVGDICSPAHSDWAHLRRDWAEDGGGAMIGWRRGTAMWRTTGASAGGNSTHRIAVQRCDAPVMGV